MNWMMSVTACAYACAALGLNMCDLCERACWKVHDWNSRAESDCRQTGRFVSQAGSEKCRESDKGRTQAVREKRRTRMGRKIAVPMALEMRPIEMQMADCSRPSLLPSKGRLLHLAGSRNFSETKQRKYPPQ